jgi:hypothetical protein
MWVCMHHPSGCVSCCTHTNQFGVHDQWFPFQCTSSINLVHASKLPSWPLSFTGQPFVKFLLVSFDKCTDWRTHVLIYSVDDDTEIFIAEKGFWASVRVPEWEHIYTSALSNGLKVQARHDLSDCFIFMTTEIFAWSVIPLFQRAGAHSAPVQETPLHHEKNIKFSSL